MVTIKFKKDYKGKKKGTISEVSKNVAFGLVEELGVAKRYSPRATMMTPRRPRLRYKTKKHGP